ncbi:MAG: hypothetical protein Q4C70_02590 [Planctomycetia bacterium]|nr:hypothetical protein [Planctomycetia bacterium]
MISSIIIQFDRQPHEFQPLETVSGTFRLVDMHLEDVNRIEFSVLWYTEGKGDEDLGVHYFETLDWTKPLSKTQVKMVSEEDFTSDSEQENSETRKPEIVNCVWAGDETPDGKKFHFTVRLPASPLSYYGKILKIHWVVRVRAFMKGGVREVKGERVFTVGHIPAVQVDLK